MDEDLIAYARQAYGWPDDLTVTAGPRGALGRIWRVEVGADRFALKEIFAEPPSDALIAVELAFAQRAADAGVRRPASHPDRTGRHLVVAPGGEWLRLHDWVDLHPIDPVDPAELGTLLARLHRCAPAMSTEPGGGPPEPWYVRVPAWYRWAAVAAAETSWAPLLSDRLAMLPELTAAIGPAEVADLIVCHRDLHPENVLADPAGALTVVDWDGIGPATPARELARALFDWFCDGPDADLDAMRTLYEAYVGAGGPGRITGPADFTMLLATRLNFLLRQAHIAIDPAAEPAHREWAEREIDEALRILPTPQQLTDVLALTTAGEISR